MVGLRVGYFTPLGSGIKFCVRLTGSDIFVLHQVFGDREGFIPFGSPAPLVIVSGGANAGFTTATYACRYPNCRIIAVEPDADNFEMLKMNTGQFFNVIPIQAAIWKTNGTIRLMNSDGASWAVRVVQSSDDQFPMVRSVTIDSLLEECGVVCADVVKLDIEGAEETVFAEGPLGWMSKCRKLIIETHSVAANAAVMSACAGRFHLSRVVEKLVFDSSAAAGVLPKV